MLSKLSVVALLCALVNISISSEVNLSVQRNQNALTNSEMFNKKILPNVKQLLKGLNDGNRQKFLRIVDGIDVNDYKFSDGMYQPRGI